MAPYEHQKIEKKWQEKWDKEKAYATPEDSSKPKAYILDMFPYPSGSGLHVGHPKGYIATDIYSRFKRMNGFCVLHPMGWDAFGLPAEEYAIKNKVHPSKAVEQNIARYKEQLQMIGLSYDWDREINTTDPTYYKWTQWIFLRIFKKGLAYESHEPINWCPSCKTGLANEDLEGGLCERCGSIVEKKPIRQWVLKITEYADRLLEDLEVLEWPESIKESQRNWIGRSEGTEFEFELFESLGQEDRKHKVKVFTTRPDTLYGATFVAISAQLAQKWLDVGWKASNEIKTFIKKTIQEELKRPVNEVPEKEGIFAGIYAKNPANGEKIPVWIVNYVLGDIGTGAIMAVPAHDERDFEFAQKYNLPIKMVVCPHYPALTCPVLDEAYTGTGHLVESGKFDGIESEKVKFAITKAHGKQKVTYKLRDWVFSRQRYWGEPIPLIHCEKCGVVAVPEKDLPVKLPDVSHYEPTGTGESPLANITDWVNVTCPQCGGKGKRETNTMPQWAGSSWYYLRFIDSHNNKAFVDKKKEKEWMPVDMYVGGAEHATRHLIYARFWHKFLFDIGAVSGKEPFMGFKNPGLIMGADGRKMSKRFGNVVNPDDIVRDFGADTLRVYEMFMGPFESSISWSTDNLVGSRRFIERIWKYAEKVSPQGTYDEVLLNQTIKQVTHDIENFGFNTVISDLMKLGNSLEKEEKISLKAFIIYLQLLAPVAPHIAQELWHNLGNKNSIHLEKWPIFDAEKLIRDQVKIVVQVNGKVRGLFETARATSEEEAKKKALTLPGVKKWLFEEPKNVVFVQDRLINFVV